MLQLAFSPFPTLHTERLMLRAVTLEDAAATMVIRNHKEVNRYIHERKPLKDIEESKARLTKILDDQANNKVIMWCICLKEQPEKLIGGIVYWNIEPENDTAEIGYELHPDYHNKGYMGEVMKEILVYGKNIMGLKKVSAYTHRENKGSIKILQNNDFQRDTDLENNLVGKTEPETQTIHSLTIK